MAKPPVVPQGPGTGRVSGDEGEEGTTYSVLLAEPPGPGDSADWPPPGPGTCPDPPWARCITTTFRVQRSGVAGGETAAGRRTPPPSMWGDASLVHGSGELVFGDLDDGVGVVGPVFALGAQIASLVHRDPHTRGVKLLALARQRHGGTTVKRTGNYTESPVLQRRVWCSPPPPPVSAPSWAVDQEASSPCYLAFTSLPLASHKQR